MAVALVEERELGLYYILIIYIVLYPNKI